MKELENFINEHGVTDDGVTNANESFEQGYYDDEEFEEICKEYTDRGIGVFDWCGL